MSAYLERDHIERRKIHPSNERVNEGSGVIQRPCERESEEDPSLAIKIYEKTVEAKESNGQLLPGLVSTSNLNYFSQEYTAGFSWKSGKSIRQFRMGPS